MKRVAIFLLLAAAIELLAGGCARLGKVRDTGADSNTRQATIESAITSMAAAHDAIVGWDEHAPVRGLLRAQPFTAAVRQAVLDGTGRPIIAHLSLVDVDEVDAGFVAVFGSGPFGSPGIYFRLRCTEHQAATLMAFPEEWGLAEYVIVAEVEAVTKAWFLIRAVGLGEYAEIEVDTDAAIVITGVLVDFVPVGEPF